MKVCRICLASDCKMYPLNNCKIHEVFTQIIGTVMLEASAPQCVCWECMHRLKSAFKLRQKAHRTHCLLLNILERNQCITAEHLTKIDRERNNLISNLASKCIDNVAIDKESTEDVKEENRLVVADDVMMDSNCFDDEAGEDFKNVEVKIEIENEQCNNIVLGDDRVSTDSEDDKKLSEIFHRSKRKVRLGKRVKGKKRRKICADENHDMCDKQELAVKRRRDPSTIDESLFTVTKLSYEEQIARIAKRQESDAYKNSRYKCTICYRGFFNKLRCDAHNLRHSEKSGSYECFICKTRLKTSRALRKHLTSQHTEEYSCKGCNFVTKSRAVAKEHNKWHTGTKYQCPRCSMEFDKVTTYLGHIRIKHVSDFVCELCGFTFLSEKGIDIHKKKKHLPGDLTMQRNGPYCEVCDVKFVSDEAYARHLGLSSRHSTDSDRTKIRNDSQSMGVYAGGGFTRPERRISANSKDPIDDGVTNEAPISCEQCGVELSSTRFYAQHFRRCHPDKARTKFPLMRTPAMCEHCGKIFNSMTILKDHMWVHTGEKRFKCDHCEKSFTQKSNLMIHTRLHGGEKPEYECPVCGKRFSFYNNRRRHMFIHTGLKPFKCDTCGKCFTTLGEVRSHTDHVHLRKPWPRRVRPARRGHPPVQ